MEFTTFLFYLFAALMVYGSLRVITARNPVHAVLYLVLVFFNASGLWMLLQAEFLAIILIMVYVGAVMVLFLFVVMMLDIDVERIREGFWSNLPLGLAVGLLMVVEMVIVLSAKYSGFMPRAGEAAGDGNTKELARELYSNYAYPVELASVILLVAIIVAVMLTLRRRTDSKAMNPADQIAVKSRDRLRIVKMATVVEPQADSATQAKEGN
ncbi:MAG TPA: NADH-quinone oxidoreductase subunit J [Rhodocyclaceae bacterium]|nr:NADH-quinone oxidoreductase subunit J [Rhodocyclaceae bacterium]